MKRKGKIITITFIVLLYRFAKTPNNLSGFLPLQWTFSLVYLLNTAVNYHLPFRMNHNCPHIITKTLSREPQAHLAEWPFTVFFMILAFTILFLHCMKFTNHFNIKTYRVTERFSCRFTVILPSSCLLMSQVVWPTC